MVEEPGEVDSREDPVVGGVLGEVSPWHSRGREFVDEKGLELAFKEVHEDEVEEELLVGGRRDGGDGALEVRVNVGAEFRDEEEGVDEEGAEVFNYENGAPANLGAWEMLALIDILLDPSPTLGQWTRRRMYLGP